MADVDAVLAALLRAVDRPALARELAQLTAPATPATPAAAPASGERDEGPLATKLLLADLLDDTVVGAASGSPNYPIRVLLGTLSARLSSEAGFAFAVALSALFRLPLGDDARLVYAFEASRAFYTFCEETAVDARARAAMAPLLATLLSAELGPVELVAVEGARTFDSASHERDGGSPHAATIRRPASFLARVRATGAIRRKALVVTG